MAQIAVIDDKEILRESLMAALSREDHAVTPFADPLEALPEIKGQRFDVVLVDLKMPRMDGLTLIREVRAAGCDTPIIMMTAYATVSTAVEAMKLGAFDYIQKPFEAEAVSVVVERALEHGRLRRENEALRASVDDMRRRRELVGTGQAMTALRRELDRVAASHATVLICGESGTGKELVASYIHQASPRADRAMLCLNCAALSASLLESELFGHERGAFTGADRTRKGRFELADKGTLLLDEISEMAQPLQAKLLRVLQEGEFERVGSSITRHADVRVIATTNRNLDDWVTKKKFRADLYYRLNVLPVSVPALRERVEDLPDLRMGSGSNWSNLRGRAAGKWQLPLLAVSLVMLAGALYRIRPTPRRIPFEQSLAYLDTLMAGRFYDRAQTVARVFLQRTDLDESQRAQVELRMGRALYGAWQFATRRSAEQAAAIVEHFRAVEHASHDAAPLTADDLAHVGLCLNGGGAGVPPGQRGYDAAGCGPTGNRRACSG